MLEVNYASVPLVHTKQRSPEHLQVSVQRSRTCLPSNKSQVDPKIVSDLVFTGAQTKHKDHLNAFRYQFSDRENLLSNKSQVDCKTVSDLVFTGTQMKQQLMVH